MTDTCPSLDELRSFLNPTGSGPDQTALMDHYLQCQTCLEKLDELARQMARPVAGTGSEAPASGPGATRGIPGMILDMIKAAGTESDAWLIGDYRVIRKIKSGGMGSVYECSDMRLNRRVAVKSIHDDDFSAETFERFRREAEIQAALKHPNIVSILEFGQWRGWPFIAMEFVSGQSLAEKIKGSTLLPATAASLVAKLARAVSYAHEQGVLHRDLKPSNILIDDAPTSGDSLTPRPGPYHWQPKIIDFGLSKWLTVHSTLSRAGGLLGTPGYMAPEQTDPNHAEISTGVDIYALGVILYESLVGQLPFRGESVEATIQQIREAQPPGLRSLNPGVPRDLEVICLKCLQKEPSKRYANALELAADLERFLAGKPILARPAGRLEKAWLWCRRNRPLAAALGLSALLAAGLVVGSIWFGVRQAELRQKAEYAERLANQERERIGELFSKESRMLFGVTQSLAAPEILALNSPQIEQLRYNILLFYAEMKELFANDKKLGRAYPEIELDLLYHLAAVYERLGDREKMAATFEEMLAMTAEVGELKPIMWLRRITAANSCGIFYATTQREDQAETIWHATWESRKTVPSTLLEQDPRISDSFLMVAGNLCGLYKSRGKTGLADTLTQEINSMKLKPY